MIVNSSSAQMLPMAMSDRIVLRFHAFVLRSVLVCLVSTSAICQQVNLEWVSNDGRRMKADFVRLQNDSDVVRKEGKEIVIEFSRLAPESVQLAKKMAHPQELSNASKGPPMKRTIQVPGSSIEFDLWGDAKRSVVFFNHSGPMKGSIDRSMADYQAIINSGWSLVTWNYPKEGVFNEVGRTIQQWVQGGAPSLLLKGYASAVVKELRSQAGIKEFILVGNSLGAGVIMSDIRDLSDCRVLLISPTEMFLPPMNELKAAKMLAVVGHNEKDSFVRSKEVHEWIESHHASLEIWKDLPEEHLIIGENLAHPRVVQMVSAILDAQ